MDKNNNCLFNVQIKQRLSMWRTKQYATLIEEYERGVVLIPKPDLSTKPSNKKEALYKRTVELTQVGQLNHA